MWYVLQTKSGDEHDLKLLIDKTAEKGVYKDSFIPLYEEVRRRDDKCRIIFRRMFPGYIFLDMEEPEKLIPTLKKIPEFTRLLGTEDEEGKKMFIPVSEEDEGFLKTLIEDGVMHVSFVEVTKTNRIARVVGPLARYKNRITKLKLRNREAIVEVNAFGKERRIRFGLWEEGDPRLPWLDDRRKEHKLGQGGQNGDTYGQDETEIDTVIDIGIHPGDKVTYEKVYGDYIFTVEKVDVKKRVIYATMELLGAVRMIELYADDVQLVTENNIA